MSEKDMINNGDTPGTPLPGDAPENFEQIMRQLGNVPPEEAEKAQASVDADTESTGNSDGQQSESLHSHAADQIMAAAEEPADESSWLDNLLAFAQQNTDAQPSEDADDDSGIPVDEEPPYVPSLSADTPEDAADTPPEEPAPTDSEDAVEITAIPEAEEQPQPDVDAAEDAVTGPVSEDNYDVPAETGEEDSAPSETHIPQWAFDAVPEPEEVNGPDWQSAFTVSDEETQPTSAAGLPESEDTAADDAPPIDANNAAAFDGDTTMQFVPAAQGAGEPAAESAIEDSGYESPKPAGKNKKPAKEFRIETDYRRDFGEYDRIHPITLDKRHKTGCVGGILYFLFILVTGALLGGMLWLAAADVLAINKPANDVEITIPEDFTIEQVADILHSNGLIKYKFLFEIFADFSSAEEKIDPGVYQLKTSYDYRALVSCMSTSGGYRVVTEVTIPEGYNQFQMFELLEEAGVCTQEQLWEAAENAEFDYDFIAAPHTGDELRLEGYLFPDTYEFYINDDPVRVLNKMLSNFNNKFTEEYRLRAEELGYSIHDIIAIASMIEKETGVDSERATIASVIYNRLASDDFPYLQIDATIIYATYVTGEEFSTQLDSPYNTYLYEGLPGPITNPGLASIRAALYPETTNYYFYAATTDFTTRFFSRYEDFEAFVNSDEFQSSN